MAMLDLSHQPPDPASTGGSATATPRSDRAAAPAPAGPWYRRLGRGPWTDPRSLASSALIHLTLLLGAASLAAYGISGPRPEAEPVERVLHGELDGIDNRAHEESQPGGGGDSTVPSAEVALDRADPTMPTRDPAADALLSEVLPTRETATNLATLPGPNLADLQLPTGPSAGSGGVGAGGGLGGGIGASVGAGTEFFGVRDRGGSYAYVIDRSGSMTLQHSLEVAKRELLMSLVQVPAAATVAVIFYNSDATTFADAAGRPGMMPANPANKRRIQDLLATIPPYGGTDHMLALRTALALRPEILFFLTDADSMRPEEVDEILRLAGKTRIHAVEFGQVGALGGSAPLRNLASRTGGSYRYIDVNTFRAY